MQLSIQMNLLDFEVKGQDRRSQIPKMHFFGGGKPMDGSLWKTIQFALAFSQTSNITVHHVGEPIHHQLIS